MRKSPAKAVRLNKKAPCHKNDKIEPDNFCHECGGALFVEMVSAGFCSGCRAKRFRVWATCPKYNVDQRNLFDKLIGLPFEHDIDHDHDFLGYMYKKVEKTRRKIPGGTRIEI